MRKVSVFQSTFFRSSPEEQIRQRKEKERIERETERNIARDLVRIVVTFQLYYFTICATLLNTVQFQFNDRPLLAHFCSITEDFPIN